VLINTPSRPGAAQVSRRKGESMKQYTITYNTDERTNLKFKTKAEDADAAWKKFYSEVEEKVFVISGSAWMTEGK
jgi:hypothetical protein